MAQIKDLKRMCEFYEDCIECRCYNKCRGCRVYSLPDDLDGIVDEWVKEHSVKTYAQDFFEKFPNAMKNYIGTPTICVKCVYGGLDIKCVYGGLDIKCDGQLCYDCWNQDMK